MLIKSLLLSCLSVLLFSITSCSSFKKPEFRSIENVNSPALGTKQSILTFDLICFNPNNSKFSLKGASGEAWIEGQKLGNFSIEGSISIPGKTTFRIPVIVDLDMKNALKNSTVLLFKDQVNLKIDGKARLGKKGFYFNYPIRYEGEQSLSQFIKKNPAF